MENIKLPLHFAQVDIHPFEGFAFMLPKEDIGRDDILITVEYHETDSPEALYLTAWAQQIDGLIRFCCFETEYPVSRFKETGVEGIAYHLNGAKAFNEGVHEFLTLIEADKV